MSGPLILPMMALLLALYVWKDRSRTLLLLSATAALALPVIAGIWATYGFRYSALAVEDSYRGQLEQRWANLLNDHSIVAAASSFARQHKLLPEAYLYGLNVVRHDSDERQAFLDGHWSCIGFGDFFARAFVYKTPIAVLLLLVVTSLAAASRMLRSRSAGDWQRFAPLVALVFVYGSFALGAGLNIGERHLLPIYPALFVACGGSARLLRQHRSNLAGAVAVTLLLAWHVLESMIVRPHYLAYTNQLCGGPRHGWQHLVDSSLDWGQDLPGLRQWLEHHQSAPTRPVYLAYFGAARPEAYGITATPLPEPSDAPRRLRSGLYCVSATALQQVYSRAMGPWCRRYEMIYQQLIAELRQRNADANADRPEYWSDRVELYHELRFARLCAALRHREPLAEIGYSILIYDVSDDDLRQAIAGPPAELFQGPQVAGR